MNLKIVNYALNNYSNEEIEKLYKNLEYVKENANKIFEEAKVWANNKLNTKLQIRGDNMFPKEIQEIIKNLKYTIVAKTKYTSSKKNTY